MALIICPECNKEVSDQSKQCIHCGYPLVEENNTNLNDNTYSNSTPENKNGLSFWSVVGAVVLALIIMSFL